MKIELATDLSTFANVVNEKPAPKPEQGTRRGGMYLYILPSIC